MVVRRRLVAVSTGVAANIPPRLSLVVELAMAAVSNSAACFYILFGYYSNYNDEIYNLASC